MGNLGNNTVTEIKASTGALVKVLSHPSDGFATPVSIVVHGSHVFVANVSANSITELDSSGTLVQVLQEPILGFRARADRPPMK